MRGAVAFGGLPLALLLAAGDAHGDAATDAHSPVRDLSAGGRHGFASSGHTCALLADGVQCWGAGGSSQLGDARYSRRRPLPTRVRDLRGRFAWLAAGGAHTCAARESQVRCWGDNRERQGGAPSPALLLEPSVVPALPSPVTALAAGAEHTCAVAAGEVWCWGRSESGALGFDPEGVCRTPHRVRPCRAPPQRVAGIPGPVSALALGDRHGCALAEGRLHCWGANARGQLGDGTREDRSRPVAVSRLPGPPGALAAGGDRTCVSVAGGARCWGATLGGDRERPGPVAGLRGDVALLAVGVDHACAALARGGVRCWGDNDYGQLGSGDAPRDHHGAVAVAAWDDGRLRDRNGDGRMTLVCLGDSNTASVHGAPMPWCERLHGLLPADWSAVNRGLGGASAVSRLSLLHAEAQLDYALENDSPDVVLLAYGTNDLLAGVEVGEIVRAYELHEQRALEDGVEVFVALTPPLRAPQSRLAGRVEALNEALRAAFRPDRIVDFFSGIEPGDFLDDLHLGDSGQAKRARAAAEALARAGFRTQAGR